MALDMANSYASSATVRGVVLFYPVATDNTYSSSSRTDQNLCNPQKKIKCVAKRLIEHNAKSKCLGEKPEVTIAILCSFIVLRNTNSFFAGTIKNKHKFKISLGQFTIYSLAFVEI